MLVSFNRLIVSPRRRWVGFCQPQGDSLLGPYCASRNSVSQRERVSGLCGLSAQPGSLPEIGRHIK